MSIGKMIKGLFAGDRPAAAPVRPPQGGSQNHWISNPWHAVSIVPCKQACDPARLAIDERFLSKEAPQLPLPGCAYDTCQCRYRHHNDRRSGLRRSGDFMLLSRSWAAKERRVSRGRRAGDLAG